MQSKLVVNDREIKYCIKKSKRARNLIISVINDEEVCLTVPLYVSVRSAQDFLWKQRFWIVQKQKKFKQHHTYIDISDKPYYLYKARARIFISTIVEQYAKQYNFKYQKITIKNQKHRWGSCSNKAILNFNYKLYFLPLPVAQYIVVHELCHLYELNHSARFWKLVADIMPDYQHHEQVLKRIYFK